MRRALVVGWGARFGGGATHLADLERHLSDRFDLRFLRVGSGGARRTALHRALTTLVALVRLGVIVLTWRPLLVHFNPSLNLRGVLRDALLVTLARALGTRVLLQIHGAELDTMKSYLRLHLALLFRAHEVLVLTREQERWVRRRCKAPVRRVYNGVDTRLIVPGTPLVPRRVLFMSLLNEDKGILTLVSALALAGGEWRLVAAGKGEARERAEALARRLGVSARFPGFVAGEEKAALLRGAWCFALPTKHAEGMPYAVLEALAAGLPVITTGTSALSELVTDGVEGFLVEGEEGVARALDALTDAETRERMSRAARERALRFDVRGWADEMAAAYERVIGGA